MVKCAFDALGVFATIPLNGSDGGLTFRASQIRSERTGVHAAVSVYYETTRLAYDTFNVTRNEERKRLSKEAHAGLSAASRKDYPCEALKNDLDNFCADLWETWQEREPAVEIITNPEEEPIPPKWLLEPLVLENQANLLYGERSGTKSLTSLIIATVGQLQWEENPLHLKPSNFYWETLYLDFERNDIIARYNLARLQRGMDLPTLFLHYKRLFGPLSRNIDWIRRYLLAHPKIKLVIIDSITPAAGANLNESAPAQDMFEAERSLNTTTLLLAHASNKNPDQKHATVIGHSAYETYAGNIWECRKQQEEGSPTADTCLYHTKAPAVYGLRKPLGYRTVFDEAHHSLTVSYLNPETISEFVEHMNLKKRVLDLLLHGEMSSKEVADSLNENYNSVRVVLMRLRSKGAIVETHKDGRTSYWGRSTVSL